MTVLGSLDRLRENTLTIIGAGAGAVTRSALSNARWSLAEISAAVEERRDLARGLTAAASPGDLARLTLSECCDLLSTKSIGRIAYVARAGVPDIVPVNYAFDGQAILVRSAHGPKLQAAERQDVVAFEVDGIDEATRTGWSVVVIGAARRLAPGDPSRHADPIPWANGPRPHIISIEPRRIDGRRLA